MPKREKLPEFDAHELNALRKKARSSDYHQKCLTVAMKYGGVSACTVSDTLARFVHGIKNECKVLLEDHGYETKEDENGTVG